ncbi:DUF4097 family beta strand repeat-containing protein [Glycomyces algeriensis]|uniref:DUF4097 domain-containing protein n=1 Tax=Glycomyces algeriensis TaxID=256037 RepID=A0A9W6G5Z5_9ACTN|nr:DUF4097 family beta strand repeat-containing protein [Glycomyces algeriensis]MDA1368383.1 DUF4097 family beta strand repeat-containing protein [Glycomyces algeriensis]MDR7353189.1 hypothetical protein [Glycomyces algeriensis]GLI40883.1 hypothetical protein GALLR39Z86_07330 [Glycomyces algeriensis]
MIDTPEKQTPAPETETQRTARTVWWIVGAACTGLVLLAAVAFAGVWIWSTASPVKSENRSETYTETTSGVDVTVEVGQIDLNASADGSLVVDTETRWRGEEPKPEESWNGDVFSAEGECDERLVVFWDGDDCEVNYTLALPSGAAAEAESSVGNIEMDGLDGAIDVETSVGDIEGENLRATETRAESSVGSIRLEFAEVRGDINVITSTGSVEIIVPDDGTTYDVVFESGVGTEDIDIATDPGSRADYVISVDTSVGDLTVRYAD